MTGPVHTVDEQLLAEMVQRESTSVFNERLIASALVSPMVIAFVVWLQVTAAGALQALEWGAMIAGVELLILFFWPRFSQSLAG